MLAVSFAAKAHRHQLRKDHETPYFAHVTRVAFTISQVFNISDPRVIAAAILHDTIEDTATDYDDLVDRFGKEIADWVSMLTKEMRLPEAAREAAYKKVLASAPWQVIVCKLADIYDNLGDCLALPPASRTRTMKRSEEYLDCLRADLPKEALPAFQIVERRLIGLRDEALG
jgi:guanosine-3',5'-bis(diphosphate) 3'-pyrophosphohydrolase